MEPVTKLALKLFRLFARNPQKHALRVLQYNRSVQAKICVIFSCARRRLVDGLVNGKIQMNSHYQVTLLDQQGYQVPSNPGNGHVFLHFIDSKCLTLRVVMGPRHPGTNGNQDTDKLAKASSVQRQLGA